MLGSGKQSTGQWRKFHEKELTNSLALDKNNRAIKPTMK